MPIIQVVGFQNSGKTTLVTKLIETLTQEGLQVGTIKHHGHGGDPKIGDRGKDTEAHRDAGAKVVSVGGENLVQITMNQGQWNVHELLSFYHNLKLDVIIIEGYKREDYPKVVMINDHSETHLLETLTNILCVVSPSILPEQITSAPFFLREEEETYIKFLVEKIRGLI